jgi:hypothetical protein
MDFHGFTAPVSPCRVPIGAHAGASRLGQPVIAKLIGGVVGLLRREPDIHGVADVSAGWSPAWRQAFAVASGPRPGFLHQIGIAKPG